jgi:hypothetical protein
MANLVTDKHDSSASRVKKHRDNKMNNGYKRVQKWVFDIESAIIQDKIKADLANYRITQDEKEWNDFANEQLENLEGWK